MKQTFRNIKTVYKYGKEYKNCLIYETIGSLFGIFIGIALPILLANQLVYLTDNNWIQLIVMSLVVLILGLINALKTVLIRKNTQKFTVGVTEKLQKSLSSEILKVSQTDLDNNSSGVFVQRMTRDTDELANMFTVGYGRLVGIISSIGTFISIFIINKYVFIFYLSVSVILTMLHLSKSRKINKLDKEKRKQQEKVTGLTSELVRGARDVKMLNAKSGFVNMLNENIQEKNKKYLDMRNVDISYKFIIECLKELFQFALIILFIYLISYENLSVAMSVALFSYRERVMQSFMASISDLLEEANCFNLSLREYFLY